MFRLLVILVMLAGPAAGDCPAVPDRSAEVDALMARMLASGNEGHASEVMDQLWRIWTTAPDAKAQKLLDEGMRRRDEYDLASAWDDFDQLVTYCPDYAEGYNQRAFVEYLLHRNDEALADADKALAIDPRHLGALTGKALIQMEMGGPAAGQATLRKALKLNPWLPERRFLIKPAGTDL